MELNSKRAVKAADIELDFIRIVESCRKECNQRWGDFHTMNLEEVEGSVAVIRRTFLKKALEFSDLGLFSHVV